MGYDDLDRALIDAWERAYLRYKDDPAKLDRVLRRFGGPTYTRPLRSWSLVLRANDKRIDDNSSQGIVPLNAERVRTWCAPILISYPGVSLNEAAQRFGVNRTTIARWASPKDQSWWQAVQQQLRELGEDDRFGRPSVIRVTGQRLMLEHEPNRANPKRSTTRVWTPGYEGLDPGGEVWSGPWGAVRHRLTDHVPDGFDQQVERIDRKLGIGLSNSQRTMPTSRVMQWLCPPGFGGCGKPVYKLYLPMPSWTLITAVGGGAVRPKIDELTAGFLCLRCAGLVYESAERASSPGCRKNGERRRLNTWSRFIRRISGGVIDASADLQPVSPTQPENADLR